jgi:hypothetical protein
MEIYTVDLSLDNPELVRLTSAKSTPNTYSNMPTQAMPPQLRKAVTTVYQALTGKPMDETDNTMSVKFDENGFIKSTYGPNVVRKDDQLVIRWGRSTFIPIEVTTTGKAVEFSVNDAVLTLEETTVCGWKNTLALQVDIDTEEALYSMAFGFRLDALNRDIEKRQVQALFRKGDKGLQTFLQYVTEAKDGGDPPQKFAELNPGTYEIVAAKSVTTSIGDTYIVEVADHGPYWAPSKLVKCLNGGMLCSSEAPVELTIVPLNGDKRRYDIVGQFDNASELDLDLGWL